MKIGFDLDDVLCDTYSIILEESLRYHCEVLKRKAIKRNIFESKGDYFYFAKSLRWGDKETEDFFYDFYPEFLKRCIPYDGVVDILKKLINRGNEVHIITARERRINEDVFRITEDWLIKWGISYNYLNLGEKDKSEYIKKNGIDIFVDDSWDNCKKVYKNTGCKVFHMICPYNKYGEYDYNKYEIIPITQLSEMKF